MDSDKPLVNVEGLTKRYLIKKSFLKKEYFYAVNRVSFKIFNNEIVGLVGESGSGKSTIGRLIIKLIKKDDGKIEFKGEDIYKFDRKREKEFRRESSMIFQDPRSSLNPRMKIYEILEEPLIVHNIPKSKRRELIEKAIVDAGLDTMFLNRYPMELSGGQRQRVAIGRAIILSPSFIVADEPTSALDVSVQLQIIELIKGLKEKKGISFLFISHDLNVIGNLSDRIIVLYKGKIMEQGKTKDIIKTPFHPYTKLLLESLPVNHPRKRKKKDDIKEIYREEIEGACLFYSRCPIAQDICKKEPEIKKYNSREVYCHLV